jgi:hypothetical protein
MSRETETREQEQHTIWKGDSYGYAGVDKRQKQWTGGEESQGM